MRTLIVAHRWLGIACCLLFAMWFATGIVMHFVPFPSLTERERVAGLAAISGVLPLKGPAEAVQSSGLASPTRVRLIQRPDGPVYIVSGLSGLAALRATDLSPAAVQSPALALDIARAHARQRSLDASRAIMAETAMHDQWTVPNGFDPHRPLNRVALGDNAGTELYVSSATGEVVLDTTRRERFWSYLGSVLHWIYPTVLRRNWTAWDRTVWTLSLVALIAALTGAVLGVMRIQRRQGRLGSPYRGWHAWHHGLGLASMTFLTTWIFSGWLSMDHGRLFSTGKMASAEVMAITGVPDWQTGSIKPMPNATEIEWFTLGGRNYRRDRFDLRAQHVLDLTRSAGNEISLTAFLTATEVTAALARAGIDCKPAAPVSTDDDYAVTGAIPSAPVFRSVCGDAWIHVDGANGAILERLDSSRRAYRWLYSALHTLDTPGLLARPSLRSALILSFCALGLVFSLTGVVIGWRRLTRV